MEDLIVVRGQRNLLALFKWNFQQLNNLDATLILEPLQFVYDAKFAIQIGGRDDCDENRCVFQLLLDLFLKIHSWLNPVIEPHFSATCQKRGQFFDELVLQLRNPAVQIVAVSVADEHVSAATGNVRHKKRHYYMPLTPACVSLLIFDIASRLASWRRGAGWLWRMPSHHLFIVP